MSCQTQSACSQELCKLLLPRLLAEGFTELTIQSLAANQALIRRLLARTAAAVPLEPELQTLADPGNASCPLFATDWQALQLQPVEWLEFIDERNQLGTRRPCEIVSGVDYGGRGIFVAEPAAPASRLLLVETANGERGIEDIEATAMHLMPNCMAATRPRMIFDVLRHLWDVFNDINAAYVLVADANRPLGTPLPIIFNPPQKALRLGFVDHIPRNSRYTGYVAYCGTQ